MIRAVVFDIGGILEPPSAGTLLGELAPFVRMERERLQAHLAEHHVALADGRMSLADLYRQILLDPGAPPPDRVVARHLEIYLRATAGHDARVVDLIERLKRRYVVACLTNTEREIGELNRRRGLYRPFDRAYLSTEIGLHKPDRAIFEWVLRDFGCAGPEAVFVDDGEANVRGARDAGLHAIHYRDFDQFSGELATLLADPG